MANLPQRKLVVGGESMPFVKYLQPILGDWALELGGTSGTLGTSEERVVLKTSAWLEIGTNNLLGE